MILSVNNSMKNLEIVLPEKYFVVATVEVSKRVNKADLDEAAVESNEMFYVLCSMGVFVCYFKYFYCKLYCIILYLSIFSSLLTTTIVTIY